MNNTTIMVWIAAMLLILTSCGKDGSMGPQGPQGEQGIRGEKGEDGATIYSGTVVPPANVGNVGDFYFHTGTSDFYGPKTASGWGTATNLRGATGATGAAGADGSKILSGTAVPASNLGANGDFYFRSSTADFYGPKAASGWGTPINLKGVKGEDGSRIYSGTTTPATSLGQVGDFYFRTTTGDFYGPKTASSWGTPTSLRGATGADGAPGSRILSGTVIPIPSLGAIGDFYLRTSNAMFYGPKTASGWGIPISLRGPQGPAGTANVIYSDWIRFTAAQWLDANISGFGNVKQAVYYTPYITTDIIDKGVVLVYMRLPPVGPSRYYQLPYHNSLSGLYVGFYPVGGTTNAIYFYSTILGGDAIYLGNLYEFRFVIIPGGISANAKLRNIDINNYKVVKGALGLPD